MCGEMLGWMQRMQGCVCRQSRAACGENPGLKGLGFRLLQECKRALYFRKRALPCVERMQRIFAKETVWRGLCVDGCVGRVQGPCENAGLFCINAGLFLEDTGS